MIMTYDERSAPAPFSSIFHSQAHPHGGSYPTKRIWGQMETCFGSICFLISRSEFSSGRLSLLILEPELLLHVFFRSVGMPVV